MAQAIPLPRYNYTTGAGGPAPENVRLFTVLCNIPFEYRN